MAYVGQNPKFTTQVYRPQSADPSNPTEGMVFRADGTSRSKGLWEYREANWQRFGSDAKTYVANYNIDSSTTSWNTYADAAGAVPVNGTGGSATTTFTFSSSSPLRGSGSGVITKDAANRQGEGISTDFTIDTADQGKVLNLTFDFTTSTNFVGADYRVFLYDVTNSLLIEGNNRDLAANGGYGLYNGSFQVSSNSTSYRLILHCATVNASAYTIKVDNFILGPSLVLNGAIVTDWIAYTPTFTGFGTAASIEVSSRRVGSNLEIQGQFTAGTVSAVTASFTLPSGLVVASPKSSTQSVGEYYRATVSSGHGGPLIATAADTTIKFSASGTFSNGSVDAMAAALGTTVGSSERIVIRVSVPIVGWSSGVQLASQTTNQVVSARVGLNSNQTISSIADTKVTLNRVVVSEGYSDTAAAFDTTNNRYVIPESGYYFVGYQLYASSYTSEENWTTTLQLNGSGTAVCADVKYEFGAERVSSASTVRLFSKGDYLEVFSNSVADASYIIEASSQLTFFHCFKIMGNQTIGMDEVVACSYESNAAQSIANNTVATVLFEDKLYDTHQSYNTSTGVFTAPISGYYNLSTFVTFGGTTGWAISEQVQLRVQVNSVLKLQYVYQYPATSASSIVTPMYIAGCFNMNKGDTILIEVFQNSGASLAIDSDPARVKLNISRIK
jgi:hypothetical protein